MNGASYESAYCVQHGTLEVRYKCPIKGVQQHKYIMTLKTKYVL